jgi:hypothetical protein
MKPRLKVLGIDLPAWGFFFSLSTVFGVVATIPLTGVVGIPRAPFFIASISGIFGMVVLAFLTKVITGTEVYNFHHYLIVIVSMAAAALWLMGEPVLRNLDVVVIGVGVTYACGRVACLRGGCCYGRPHLWGFCYPIDYLNHGFPPGLVGVKLFPSQIVESLWMWATTASAVTFLLRSAQPGSAFAWFIVLYSVGRFFSDFYRLEAGFCIRGLSEAQIASIGMTCVVFGAEQMAWLPAQPIHGGAALLLIIVGIPRLLIKSDYKQLFTTEHVIEIADAVKRADNNRTAFSPQTSGFDSRDLSVQRTSLGLLISAGTICTSTGSSLIHYCVSREGTLRDSTAQGLAKLISVIHGRPGEGSLIKGDGAFHIIISGSSHAEAQPDERAAVPRNGVVHSL